MPDIQPDWSAPGLPAVTQVVSWVLAVGMVVAALGLLLAIICLAFKGFGNSRVAEAAGPAALISFIVLAVLGSFSGLMALSQSFDLGL